MSTVPNIFPSNVIAWLKSNAMTHAVTRGLPVDTRDRLRERLSYHPLIFHLATPRVRLVAGAFLITKEKMIV